MALLGLTSPTGRVILSSLIDTRGRPLMAARTKTKVTPKYKTKYRVKNWATYDAALRDRGDITVWLTRRRPAAWNAPPSGRPGGQRRYSDLAIVTALTLRTVFHLPLRQTEGFVASLMGLSLKTPDHTTLSRRNRDVEVPRLARVSDGPLPLPLSSTTKASSFNAPGHEFLDACAGSPRSGFDPPTPVVSPVGARVRRLVPTLPALPWDR